MRTRISRFFKFSSYFLLLISFLLVGCATYNAATGRYDYLVFTPDSEVALGQVMHLEIALSRPLVKETVQLERLHRIGRRIAQVSDRQDLPYEFYVIKDDSLNAFTIPGGHIYFNTGLLSKMNDNQVAAVMAHELGHNAARHTIKKFQGVLGYNLIGGAIISKITDDDKKRIAALGANFIVSLALNAYSRQDELEADKLGVKYMYLAGYEPEAMITTFEVLQENEGKSSTPSFMRTHPYLKDRIESVKNEIERVKNQY